VEEKPSLEFFSFKRNVPQNHNSSKQHIIPACLLSQFSMKPKYKKRDSEVFAKFKGMDLVKKVNVSNFLKKKDYYTLTDKDGKKDQMIDLLWDDVEKILTLWLDSLNDIKEDTTFLKIKDFIVLVEFIAEHFSRSIAFEDDFKNRLDRDSTLKDFMNIDTKSNINLGRILEIYALRPFIFYSELILMKAPENFRFINNENGFLNYTLFDNPNKIGFAIPLSKKLILGCILNENISDYDIHKKINDLEKNKGKSVKVHQLSRMSAEHFNHLVAFYSNTVIFGPVSKIVQSYNLGLNKIQYPGILWANQLQKNQLPTFEKISRDHEKDFEVFCEHFNKSFGLTINRHKN